MGFLSMSKFIVDISQLRSNIINIKNLCKDKKFCMMIKSDAYGHGAKMIAKKTFDLVDCFGVASIEEGIELRKAKIENEILVMGPIISKNYRLISKYKLALSLGSVSDVIKLSSECKYPIKVHFQVNSGMNRFGFSKKEDFLDAFSMLKKNTNLQLVGVYSHFATKENDLDFMNFQNSIFCDFINVLDLKDVTYHISNSCATLHHCKYFHDMVRCGFACYGWIENDVGIKPILSIKSVITSLHVAESGETVGYDRTFILRRQTKIATIPLGYADGIDRRLSNKGYFLINGNKARIIGNICMDCTMLDVTDIENIEVGDEVTILGVDKFGSSIKISDYAKLLDISEYDALLKFRYRRLKVCCLN